MSAAAPMRRGWCPGALRPMPTGDGLLVRLRLTGGVLGLSQARDIAACAERFGNGLIDLTARANLQLRGVSEATLEPLTGRLADLGLIGANAAAEAVRNIVSSPLAGLDATAWLDIRPVVAALEARIADDASLHGLPAKFCFLIDDGGCLGLADVDADVRFEAVEAGFAIQIAGANAPMGVCLSQAVPDVAAAIAKAFLELRGRGADAPRRMRQLVKVVGGAAIASAAFARVDGFLPVAEEAVWRPRADAGLCAGQTPRRGLGTRPPMAAKLAELLGPHRLQHRGFVGVAATFGRLAADDLDRIAKIAERFGAQDLRLTPWRTILATGLGEAAADRVATAWAEARLILNAADPRLAVVACPGAPACEHATTSTRDDAMALAPIAAAMAGGAIGLHVSGCPKGCARARAAPFTLVGDRGRYDLVLGGTAHDPPIAAGLTMADARAHIAGIAERWRTEGRLDRAL